MGEGAALLTPVPVGAVVYGEGEQAVVLTKVRGREGRGCGLQWGRGGVGLRFGGMSCFDA